MERMKDFIQRIFEQSSYETSSLMLPKEVDGFFAACNATGVKNYFLVIFVESLNDLLENISGHFVAVKNHLGEQYEPAVDKNTSLIVCYRMDSEYQGEELCKSTIHQIEEDPYDFKKYVLPYTDNQLEGLLEHLSQYEMNIQNGLNTLLYKEGTFKIFKEDPIAPTEYNLLTKMFIKIPFLKLEIHRKDLGNLSDIIDVKLSTRQLSLKQKVLDPNSGGVNVNTINLSMFGKGSEVIE